MESRKSYSLLKPDEFNIIKTLQFKYGEKNVKIVSDKMYPTDICFKLLMSETRAYKFILFRNYDELKILVQMCEVPYWTDIIDALFGKIRFANPFLPKDLDDLLILIDNIMKGKYKKYEELNRRCIKYKRVEQIHFQESYYYIINSFRKLLDDKLFYDHCKKIGIEKIGDCHSNITLCPVIVIKELDFNHLYESIDRYVLKKVSQTISDCTEHCLKTNPSAYMLVSKLKIFNIFTKNISRYLNATYKFNKEKDVDKYDALYK